MDWTFTSIGTAALATGAAAARMLWSARKPAPPAPCCGEALPAAAPPAPLQPWYKRVLAAIDYLRTRREWRYKTPWVMLLGERGSGKSSLVASVPAEHRQAPDWRDEEIGVTPAQWHAQWHLLREGVLIDVDGKLPQALAGSAEATQWERLLAKIDALRPERALDGLVLTVSAASLRDQGAKARQALAQDVYRQLNGVLDRFGFALPVYVVVTQCDAIPGFAAFWRTQQRRCRQMFGWSLGAQVESDSPEQWAADAFDGLGERLKDLQIEVAAERDSIPDADAFFLFPRHFQECRAGLMHFMSVVFQANAWSAGFICRGVYFTGWVDGAPPQAGLPFAGAAFVGDLVARKVLAEPNLARPTRKGILSRNRLIRAVQLAGVFACAGLALWFSLQAFQFRRQLTILADAIETVRQAPARPEAGQTCMAKDRVFELAALASHIDANLHYASMPVSYLVPKAGGMGADVIADHALEEVILPALACRLAEKAKTLVDQDPFAGRPDDPDANSKAGEQAYRHERHTLLDDLAQIDALEVNLARFDRIASKARQSDRQALLAAFIGLLQYAYDDAIPAEIRNERGALSTALVQVRYEGKLDLPNKLRPRLHAQLMQMGDALEQALDRETKAGKRLLDQLATPVPPPTPEAIRHFGAWLVWARGAWLGSTADKNPCAALHEELRVGVRKLVEQHRYDASLEQLEHKFDTANCYAPLVEHLLGMRLPPDDRLFVRKDGAKCEGSQDGKDCMLDLNAGLVPESQGMVKLVTLDFMQAQPAQEFVCNPAASGWNTALVMQASNYLREYLAFIRNQRAGPADPDPLARPLYDKLARQQLAAVMWRLMSDAQVRTGAASPLQRASLDPVAAADQQMAQASADFSRAVDPLLGALRLFEQNDFAKAVEPVAQCVRDFAAGNLGRVDQLVSASRLYAPDGGSGDADFFNLGPLPVTKDYLARQIARSQILAGYATPFLAALQNTEPHNEAQRPNQQGAAYWSNSIAELNSYTQTQEPNGQVGHLHELFLKSFSGINAANCGKELASYQPPEPGNDMFSARREQLENRVRWTCSDHGRAQAYASYFELAARFDRELRGRYPFGPPGSADAQPATVRSFFADYQNKRAALRMLAAAQQGAGWERVRGFIASLDAAADFFKTLLPADDAAQPARLAVTFRALPDASPGSDQLVSWALTSGAHSIGYPNRIGPLDWYVGQPLVLDLTWANRSPWLPAADPRQADLQRDGASASFSAAGEWALLRLVERHRARGAASDDGGLDPARVLLEFAVPVVPAANQPGVAADRWARMHLAVSLSAKDAKTQAATTLRLPAQFPRFAPPFPQFPTQEASWTQRSSNARKNTL